MAAVVPDQRSSPAPSPHARPACTCPGCPMVDVVISGALPTLSDHTALGPVVPMESDDDGSALPPQMSCQDCGGEDTPMWRRGERFGFVGMICNACYVYRAATAPAINPREPTPPTARTTPPTAAASPALGDASPMEVVPRVSQRHQEKEELKAQEKRMVVDAFAAASPARIRSPSVKLAERTATPAEEEASQRPRITYDGGPCVDCGCTESPQWRSGERWNIRVLCNACGIYRQRHNRSRTGRTATPAPKAKSPSAAAKVLDVKLKRKHRSPTLPERKTPSKLSSPTISRPASAGPNMTTIPVKSMPMKAKDAHPRDSPVHGGNGYMGASGSPTAGSGSRGSLDILLMAVADQAARAAREMPQYPGTPPATPPPAMMHMGPLAIPGMHPYNLAMPMPMQPMRRWINDDMTVAQQMYEQQAMAAYQQAARAQQEGMVARNNMQMQSPPPAGSQTVGPRYGVPLAVPSMV